MYSAEMIFAGNIFQHKTFYIETNKAKSSSCGNNVLLRQKCPLYTHTTKRKLLDWSNKSLIGFLGMVELKAIARARVAWKLMCVPKKEGGLGIKKLEVWNRATIMRHIWGLFAKAGSLWVVWVRDKLLKGQSFWQIRVPQSCSWCWQNLLKLRVEARNFLKFDDENGSHIQLWIDWWHPNGVLLEKYGYRAIYDVQSRLDARFL